jgi:ABC-type branched-subunit amino acid transport system substrate-binding protein
MTRRRLPHATVIAAFVTAFAAIPGVSSADAATEAEVPGVTRSTVTVAGIVTGDAATAGADIGAQARLFRENSRGGVAGRLLDYAGTEIDHGVAAESTAAVTKRASSVFAFVPVITPAVDAAALDRQRIPFFGSAVTTAWQGSAAGFGATGAEAVERPKTASPAWGLLLSDMMGSAAGRTAIVAVDGSALGSARAQQARASLRATGFTVLDPVVVGAPVATGPAAPVADLAPYASALVAAKPDVALLLTPPSVAAGLAAKLAALGFTGTVGSDSLYDPANPSISNGVTTLTTVAPLEQDTAANRRMAADVRLVKADQAITPAVAAGYWAADLFVAALRATGKRLTVKRFLAAANGGKFRHAVPGTVGPSSWPAMHQQAVPCGALVQSDGTRYFLAQPYRCGTTIRLTGRAGSGTK